MKNIKVFLLSIILLLTISTGVRAEFFSDVIVTSPNAIWTDSRAYATLNAAITAVGANQRTVKIVSPQVVAALTIPANVTLEFDRDGSITNSGQLTIQTKNIIAPNRQIFTGVGNIDFADGTIVKTGWFPSIESAFALTVNDKVTLIVSKSQTITASYSPGTDVNLKWEAPGNILTANAGVNVTNIGQIEAGNYQIMAGAGHFHFRDGPILNLAWFTSITAAVAYIDTAKVVLEVNVSSPVAFSVSLPSNIQLKINRGGDLTIAGGQTLTLTSSKQVDVGPYYFNPFAGTGSVTITSGSTYTPATTLTASILNGLVDRHYEVDALYDYGSGTAFTQATIEAALTAIGTTNKVTLLLRPGTWVISSNADWSAYTNVTFKIVLGAVISHGAFTVNLPNLDAGLYQVFSGNVKKVTLSGKVKEVYPEWFGTNTTPGTTDMTEAIASAIHSTDQTVIITGTNIVDCATTVGWAEWWGKASFLMKSNMHLKGLNGKSILKIKNGVSSDAAPLTYVMFASIEDLDDISFDGITFDLNGQNNLQSPLRPATYARLRSFAITSAYENGRVDNLRVENCVFKNGPGTNVIVIGHVHNGWTWAQLSNNVIIRNNRFIDNGMDTDDHTTIMSNATNAIIEGNIFTSPNYAIKRNTALQVGGSNSQVKGNYIDGYAGGFVLGESSTGGVGIAGKVKYIEISGNIVKTFSCGLWFDAITDPAVIDAGFSDVLVHDNIFEMVDSPSTFTTQNAAFFMYRNYALSNIFIYDNRIFRSGGTNYAYYGVLLGTKVAGEKSDNIHIYNNSFDLLTQTIKFPADAGNGGHGRVYINNNTITNSTSSVDSLVLGDGIAISGIGIYLNVLAGQVADYVRLTGNHVIDSQALGIALQGTFTAMYYGQDNQILGAATDFQETSTTITTRYGTFPATSFDWNPGSLADGVGETSGDITVPGAKIGDFVLVSPPYALSGITCNGWVKTTNKVAIRLQNETGGTLDLANGAWKIRLISAE